MGAAATEEESAAWREHVAGERDKAKSYDKFVSLKREASILDYSDQLLLARQVLTESTTARTALSARYSHLFVDDLHTYSPAMMNVLTSMASSVERITATADPYLEKQFLGQKRPSALGPKLAPIALFRQAFPDADVRTLEVNHRSSSAVQRSMLSLQPRQVPLDMKRSISEGRSFNSDLERCNSHLEEVKINADCGGTVTYLSFNDESQELGEITKKVHELVADSVSPGDIGVAVDSRKTKDVVVATLQAAEIPVEGIGQFNNVFDNLTIRMLMSFLRCLLYPSESPPMLHLLTTCPAYKLPGGELAVTLEGHLSRYVPLRSFLRDLTLAEGDAIGQEETVSPHARAVAGKFLSDIGHFVDSAKTRGVREVIVDFLRHTGQLKALEKPNTVEEEVEAAAVAKFFEVMAMAEAEVGDSRIVAVEPVLCLYRKHGIGRMPPSQQNSYGPPPAAMGNTPANAVQVFSMREALEICTESSFHTVFIPHFTKSRYPGRLLSARLPVPGSFRGMPEGQDKASLREAHSMNRVSHENRCRTELYAAVGCARTNVVFSVASQVLRGRSSLNPSPMLPQEGLTKEGNKVSLSTLVSSKPMHEDSPAQDLLIAESSALRTVDVMDTSQVEPLSLSFSSISTYLRCPYSFYLEYVLHVCSPPTPLMVYGRAMHEAVAMCLRQYHSGASPTLQAMADVFRLNFSGCAFDSAAQIEDMSDRGIQGLECFLIRLLTQNSVPGTLLSDDNGGAHCDDFTRLLVEHKFKVDIPEVGVTLSGIFDRIDMTPTNVGNCKGMPPSYVRVTDYKSNVGKKNPQKMVKDSLQLQLYSLGAQRLFDAIPTEIAIESIEDGQEGVANPSPDDLDIALEAISEVATGVRKGQFDATPSFTACMFCGFKHTCQHSASRYCCMTLKV
ncbi:unnamed protein product [Choristocarpus tenellus]